MELDDLDLAILNALEKDGRASHAAIGREIGMSGPGVYARVSRMEQQGVIRGYTALVDPAAKNLPVLAYVRVSTHPTPNENDTFEALVADDSRIEECHDVAGEDSFLLRARCASLSDLRSLIVKVRSRPGVTRTNAAVVLETLKGRYGS